jgi:predicted AlkP superfamily pyrophosphatase or phosphodiesterase
MQTMKKSLLIVLVLLLGGCVPPTGSGRRGAPVKDLQPTVLLISLDGFRFDYFEKAPTPNLDRLAREGVKAKWMTPIFPSMTFPNHYSIVTGLYAENHGIVNNSFYDPEYKAGFSMGNRAEVSNGRWWGGEPIWVTAEKQGQRSGTFFWPGTEAEIAGVRPSHWKPYDGKISYPARVDTVLNWLSQPAARRPTLFTLYFSDVDHQGHEHGPDSPEVVRSIAAADSVIGYLIAGLERRKIFDKINIIIVSDHGMSPTSLQRITYLDDFVNMDDVEQVNWGVVTGIWPKPGREEAVYRSLQEEHHPHMQVYRKSEIPARYHYQSHRRIAPILCVAGDAWYISSRAYIEKNKDDFNLGNHGYDNQAVSMRSVFIARGPAFKQGFTAEPFLNIHLYNLMTHILNLKPAPNDGSLDSLRTVLIPNN